MLPKAKRWFKFTWITTGVLALLLVGSIAALAATGTITAGSRVEVLVGVDKGKQGTVTGYRVRVDGQSSSKTYAPESIKLVEVEERKPSADGTMAGPGVPIIDNDLHVFEIGTDGRIYRDGAVIVPSNDVEHLLFYKGDVWQTNQWGWWKYIGGTKVWDALTSDPRVPPVDPDPDPEPEVPSQRGNAYSLDCATDNLESKFWSSGSDVNPYDAPNASWFDKKRRYHYTDPDMGRVCRFEAQASGGSFGGDSMGAGNTRGIFELPGGAQTSWYAEIDWRVPSQQGAWPAFWSYNNKGTGTQELDFPEQFGDDVAVFTKHIGNGSNPEFGRVKIPGRRYRIGVGVTGTTVTGYINGKAVGSTSNSFPNTTMDLDVRIQGIAYPGIPEWRWTGVPAGFSGTYYLDVKTINVWTGRSTPLN